MTIELKQEYQLSAENNLITRPNAESCQGCGRGGRARGNCQGKPCLHPRGQFFFKT